MTNAAVPVYRGLFPVAPENGDLDLENQRRVLDCMIDQGVDGICILANYGDTDCRRALSTPDPQML